ncbi:MAG: hypothetical protein JXQ90_10560 [Cyclobacteriaceae bacterium]
MVAKRKSKKYLILSLLMMAGTFAFAQTSRDVGETPKVPKAQYQAFKKAEKKRSIGEIFRKKPVNEVEAFRANMKEKYKQKAKDQKLAQKPQYSNPLYFGHKKPPKKRPPGKQKFCKECHLKH